MKRLMYGVLMFGLTHTALSSPHSCQRFGQHLVNFSRYRDFEHEIREVTSESQLTRKEKAQVLKIGSEYGLATVEDVINHWGSSPGLAVHTIKDVRSDDKFKLYLADPGDNISGYFFTSIGDQPVGEVGDGSISCELDLPNAEYFYPDFGATYNHTLSVKSSYESYFGASLVELKRMFLFSRPSQRGYASEVTITDPATGAQYLLSLNRNSFRWPSLEGEIKSLTTPSFILATVNGNGEITQSASIDWDYDKLRFFYTN